MTAVRRTPASAADNCSELDRRGFLKLAGAATAAGTAAMATPLPALADHRHGHDSDEDVGFDIKPGWSEKKIFKEVRKLFVLPKDSVYMNIGTTGSMPRQVLKNYNDYNRLVAEDPWEMGGEWGGFPYTNELAARIAPQYGCDPSELIISRNTTDGMCSILHGLDLKAGDHVITTHHEHVAAEEPLAVLANRIGIDLEIIDIPVFATSEDEYLAAFAAAVRPNTRLIEMSHITYKTGAVLPVERICNEIAVPNGIVTVIDGAHASGMLHLDLHAINCDFYSASGHKWQCGPGGTGLLYVRDNASRAAQFWPDREPLWAVNSSLATYAPVFGWQWVLQYKGQDNYPALRALATAATSGRRSAVTASRPTTRRSAR